MKEIFVTQILNSLKWASLSKRTIWTPFCSTLLKKWFKTNLLTSSPSSQVRMGRVPFFERFVISDSGHDSLRKHSTFRGVEVESFESWYSWFLWVFFFTMLLDYFKNVYKNCDSYFNKFCHRSQSVILMRVFPKEHRLFIR